VLRVLRGRCCYFTLRSVILSPSHFHPPSLSLSSSPHNRDLHSPNPFVVGLGLTALGNIGSAEMARDLAADVDRHLQHANPYIRKKAALTTIRLLRKVPDLVDTFLPRIVVLCVPRAGGRGSGRGGGGGRGRGGAGGW
jgi:hypothetical protein